MANSSPRPGRGTPGRGSWQPWHIACSPGWKCVPERIEVIARPFSSRAWKYSSFLAGTRKYALPSDSTGTVPSTARARLIESLPCGICRPVLCVTAAEATDRGRTW